MKSGIKAILFDLSDTLISYRPNYTTIYTDRLVAAGLERSNINISNLDRTINDTISLNSYNKFYKGIAESDLQTMIDRVLLNQCLYSKENLNINMLLKKISFVQMPNQTPYFVRGSIELLKELSDYYKIGIVSNHSEWMYNYIANSSIQDYLSCLIISEMVGLEKPDPKILEIAFSELNLLPEECCYVGDQAIDVICAKKAGCMSILLKEKDYVLPEYCRDCKEDIRISSISDMKLLVYKGTFTI